MIAVIVDHTGGILYTARSIAVMSYFSVTLFVFLSGVTSYYSNGKHRSETYYVGLIRRLKGIVIPYAAATAIYQVIDLKFWDLRVFLDLLTTFSASDPFYFVVFYIQLLVISPVLYKLVNIGKSIKTSWAVYLLEFLVILYIAVLSLRYTFIAQVHGGGKYLFGSTYLIFYFLGMLFAQLSHKFSSVKTEIIHVTISLICVILWYKLVYWNNLKVDARLPFGGGFNPPSISFGLYGLLMAWFLFSLFSLMIDCKIIFLNRLVKLFSFCGKYSLYIFLYHFLILRSILPCFDFNNIFIMRAVYMLSLIALPILGKVLYDKLCRAINNHSFTAATA